VEPYLLSKLINDKYRHAWLRAKAFPNNTLHSTH